MPKTKRQTTGEQLTEQYIRHVVEFAQAQHGISTRAKCQKDGGKIRITIALRNSTDANRRKFRQMVAPKLHSDLAISDSAHLPIGSAWIAAKRRGTHSEMLIEIAEPHAAKFMTEWHRREANAAGSEFNAAGFGHFVVPGAIGMASPTFWARGARRSRPL